MRLSGHKIVLFVAGLLCSFLPATGQRHVIGNIKFEQLSEGLSERSVTCILHDSKGFMWFGTRNGLNRYDGIGFFTYEYVYGDSTSLSGNFINSLVEDSLGNIWVGTLDAGLNLYNREKDSFIRYQPRKGDQGSLSDNWISDLFLDSHNNLWIGTEKEGLDMLPAGGDEFRHYKSDPGDPNTLNNNHVRVIFEDDKSNLWIGTYGGGLDMFDRKNNRFVHHRHSSSDESTISSDYLYSYVRDSDGNFWVGTRDGLNLIVEDKNGYKFKRYKPNVTDPTGLVHNIVLSVAEDNFGRIWLGMENGGLVVFDRKENTFHNFWPNPLDPTSVGSNSIWTVYKDRMGTMWLGARNRGINKWDPYHSKFIHHILPPSGDHKLANNDVMCFVEDEAGNLWIGTDGGGLNYYDRKSNTYTHYVHDPKDPESLSSNSVISLELDSHGDLWIGTWEGGLNRFNKERGTFDHFYHDPQNPGSIGSNYVFSIFEDSRGRLWVGTFYEGLDLFDRQTGTFTHFRPNLSNPDAIGHNRVFTMYEDSRHNIWIGTEGGGLIHMRWEGKTPVFKSYRYNPKDPTSPSSNIINAIYEDSHNNLWIGTWAGLNKFDYESKTFAAFRKEDGLADNVVYGIIEDGRGALWVSTNQGISKFDPARILFENFNTTDGLQAQEFIRGSFLKSRSGEFFFGGVNGFNSFFPDNIPSNPFVPPVYITGFWVHNELMRPGHENSPLRVNITETREIELPYNRNEFSLEFVALNYSQAFKNTYAWILEGYDKDWRYAGSQRRASYAKVPAGEYVFRVKASNNDGVWNERGAMLRITVHPPWWKTWWAYSAYGIFISFLFLWYRQNLINRERLKNDLKLEHLELMKMQELDKMKTTFFTNISHEFRTPLTLILSPIRDMFTGSFKGDVRQQYQTVIRNAERLLRLINQLLDLSRLGAGSMKLKTRETKIVQFLKPIAASFSSLAQSLGIDFTFRHPEESPLVYVDPDKFEKIITNLLSNAFKFTLKGGVVLSVRAIPQGGDQLPGKKGPVIEVSVADTGIGIPAPYIDSIFDHFYQVGVPGISGSGIGLSLTKELVELHGGRIYVKSTEGKGSTFRIILPCGRDHLNDSEIDAESPSFIYPAGDGIFSGDAACLPNEGYRQNGIKGLPHVLIVEDNCDMHSYIAQCLEESNRITVATDGKEGLRAVMNDEPDLVISDVMMPGMDGMTLCAELKANLATSHIPVILLTARADLDSKVTGLETGADEYLAKPFSSVELKARVRNLIRSRAVLRKKFSGSKLSIPEPSEVSVTSLDEKFLTQVLNTIESNISNPGFGVEMLSQQLLMDNSTLYRKIKALTGQTAVEFIRTIRLKKAGHMLRQRKFTVAEVTYAVGFNDLQYFRTCFKKHFGISPSQYISRVNSQINS